MTSPTRPSWQVDACPSWCVTEHRESDLPDDRFHDSAGTFLDVTVLRDSDRTVHAGHLFLGRFRRVGSPDEWLHLAGLDDPEFGVTITLESARRLGDALHAKAAPAT